MKTAIQLAATCFFLFVSLPGFAVPFTNGDFSSGMAAWNDASSSGAVNVVGDVAILDTGAGDDPFSAVLVQGDDGFFNFLAPISLGSDDLYLNFDVRFDDLGADSLESATSLFTDYLLVNLYDALDPFADVYLDPQVDASLAAGWHRINLDVSALAGHDVALSFELNDENDGRDSRVQLDNITFSKLPEIIGIPAPHSGALIVCGLLFLIGRRLRSLSYPLNRLAQ